MLSIRKFIVRLMLSAFLFSPLLLAGRTERHPASPGGTLQLNLKTGGSIEVEGWGRNEVEVQVVGDDDCDGCSIEIIPSASGVEIRSQFEQFGRGNRSSHLEFLIRVPEVYNIDLDSMGGGLKATGLEGTIRGQTMGGELDFEGLLGEVRLTTMGGNVTLRNSEVDGEITTMGGKVLFEHVRGDVKGKSMGGNVIYRNVENTSDPRESVGDEVHIETMGGAINVEEAPHGAIVRTMGGNIKIGSASEYVKATTYGGDITLEAADGEVDATTYSGDIEVNMIGTSGDVELRSLQGTIEISLPAGFSGSIDVELAFTRNSRRNYSIQSDFPIEVEESNDWDYSNGSPRRYRYGSAKVGDGGPTVRLTTINGDIIIRRGN